MATVRYVRTWCDYHLSEHKEVEATQRMGLIMGEDVYQADLCDEDYNARTIAEVFAVATKVNTATQTSVAQDDVNEAPEPPEQVVVPEAVVPTSGLAPGQQPGFVPWNKGIKGYKINKRARNRSKPCLWCERVLVTGPGYANHVRSKHPEEYVKLYPGRLIVVGNKPDGMAISDRLGTPEDKPANHVIPPGAHITTATTKPPTEETA